jgi:hypothetical protein
MANNDVDGGAAPDLPARGRELFERPSGREVGAAGANDRAGAARWAAAQDRNAGGDERHSLFAAHRLPLAKANPVRPLWRLAARQSRKGGELADGTRRVSRRLPAASEGHHIGTHRLPSASSCASN